jgi:hypothetical protein
MFETIANVDAVWATEGSIEVLLNVWNHLTQDEALGAWDRLRGSDAICH